mgnify:CR=1 FL=1
MSYLSDVDPISPLRFDSRLTDDQHQIVLELSTIYELFQKGHLSKSDYERAIWIAKDDSNLDVETLTQLVEKEEEENTEINTLS